MFDIDDCGSVKEERIEWDLYGKVIGILLCCCRMFKMGEVLLEKKEKELREYKGIGMIEDDVFVVYEGIEKREEIRKVLMGVLEVVEKKGGKCDGYEKKRVFDIMGVMYEYNGLRKEKKAA